MEKVPVDFNIVSVQCKGVTYTINLSSLLKIDSSDIETELTEAATTYSWYNSLRTTLEYELDRAEKAVVTKDAELFFAYNEGIPNYTGKPTNDAKYHATMLNPDRVALVEAVAEKSRQCKEVTRVCFAIERRMDHLRSLRSSIQNEKNMSQYSN